MKELFVEKRFSADAQSLIETINGILDEYETAGYDLSLRQVYYQLVARDIVPNTEQSYKRIGTVVSDARLAGLLDWAMIKDRGREVIENQHWESPAEILRSAAASFRLDLWADQETYVEVMVEKQALEGVLMPVCQTLDVAFTANKGYSSSSALYEAGKRLAEQSRDGDRRLVVFYLGDHDPSGIDMSRDVQERLSLFSGCSVDVRRVALNMDQIRAFRPPPNPAKMTDSRAAEYVRQFGQSSWELDAIEPARLASLVTDAVTALRNEELWTAALARQDEMKTRLRTMARTFR